MPAESGGGKKNKTVKKAAKKATKTSGKRPTAKPAAKAAKTAKEKTAKAPKPTARSAPAGAEDTKRVTKAPKRARSVPTTARLRVKQVRSGIGHRQDFRRTLEALGIRHHQDEVVVKRSPAIDGMLYKVRHLIRVTPEE